jgi:glycosyltransferase involved in cell wall biosynthesis
MLLSIIIPVYNAEKYIERCVNSVIDQTNSKNENIELIIINDGSTDSSLKIIERLKILHPIIKLYEQKNSGEGYTRNIGLTLAKGAYIWFIDADDYIDNDILERINETLINQKPEAILIGYKTIDSEGNKVSEVKYIDEVLTRDGLIEKSIYSNTVWSKIMSNEIIKFNKLKFNPNVKTATDFDFSFRLLYFTTKIVTLKNANYNYVINPDSISNIRSADHLSRLAKDSVIVATNIKKFLEFNEAKHLGSRDVFMLWLNNYLYGLLFSVYRFNYDIKFVAEIIEELKVNNNYPVKTKNMSLKKKIFMFVANQKPFFLIICKIKQLINN